MEKLKTLIQSKQGKWLMGGGLVLVLFLVFMRRGKPSGGVMLASDTGGGSFYGGGGGSSSDSSGVDLANLTTTFNQALEQQRLESEKQLDAMNTQYGNMLLEMTTEMEARTNLLQTSMQAMREGFENQLQQQRIFSENQQSSLLGIIGGLNNSLNQMENRFENQLATMYTDYNNQLGLLALTRMNQSPVSPTYQEPTPVRYGYEDSPALGYGGIDYNTATREQRKMIEENQARIKNDENYRLSEIERTRNVIAEREKAGLDTSAQRKYLEVNLQAG